MLHVNDDNADELFRKAADDYFLDADNPDWQKCLNKINTTDISALNNDIDNKKKIYPRLLHLYGRLQSVFHIFRFYKWIQKNKKKLNDVCCPAIFLFFKKQQAYHYLYFAI